MTINGHDILDEYEWLKTFGDRLRSVKKYRCISFQRLSNESMVSTSALESWCAGKFMPNVHGVIRVACALNCDPGYLLLVNDNSPF